jgi:hypothetical protein
LISAVLRILGTPELPRRVSRAETEDNSPQAAAAASPASDAPIVDSEHQAVAAPNIVRPLLPDPSVLFSPGARSDLGGYLRALHQLTTPKKAHSVDVFE